MGKKSGKKSAKKLKKKAHHELDKKAIKKLDKKARKARVLVERRIVKSKCCRKKTRCLKCPTVIHRLNKSNALELDQAAFMEAVKHARRW